MKSDYGSNIAKLKEMGELSAPPGFASLTSFILKKGKKVTENDKRATCLNETKHVPVDADGKNDVNDIGTYYQIFKNRPWILSDQSKSNDKPEESHTEFIPMDHSSNASRPKGITRGCPNCNNCLKQGGILRMQREKPLKKLHFSTQQKRYLPPKPNITVYIMKEFNDTLKYIASIRSSAEPYGICRIVPPTRWKPPCSLEEKNLWEGSEFVAQIQQIDGIQVQHAEENVASSCENTKAKRRRVTPVDLDSHLANASTCTVNSQGVEDCVSEPCPKFSLKTFKNFADEFKIQYFDYEGKNKNVGSDLNLATNQHKWEPSVENIEGEYGRIVQNPTEKIEVLHGNTLEAEGFSSGFPTAADSGEEHISPEYLKSGWNLNNINSLPGSLLSFESSGASHNFGHRIHVGMCFTLQKWKVEEHHLYLLSYLHLGEPKVWYSIPRRYAANYETIRKKYLSGLHARQPDIDDNLMMQLSCFILKAEGIPVYRCVQYPREFVLVFPGAYHSGFDCGFNCSESVNFAPLEWLLHGLNVVELYCEKRKKTLISYDKLLLGAAKEAVKARWEIDLCMNDMTDKLTCKDAYQRSGILAKALGARVKSESIKREYLCSSLKSQRMDESFDTCVKRECGICLCDLHLSAVHCLCSEDKFACLDHAKQLCPCSWSNKILLYRYEISELNVLCQALEGKLSAVYKWAKEYLGLRFQSVASNRQMKQNGAASGIVGNPRGNCISSFSITPKEKTKAKEKTLGGRPPRSCANGGTNSTSIKTDMKAPVSKSKPTTSKKVQRDQKVSTVSSITNSRYLSFLQQNTLVEVPSDSCSSSSSESDNA
ncbi:putative lysine-specific demethylase JMJ16 isoform X1 [Arachis stenosperma]|uniref:putative lysine-specific demethylase JMJ16 isoform X1 n=3 Tax=Arachis stenosperma TaxID=217475 RepID=UPI0025AC454C|nr:putative lysine-specific demethylase JMJ16 isoform X1 [Arachis stenosperma]